MQTHAQLGSTDVPQTVVPEAPPRTITVRRPGRGPGLVAGLKTLLHHKDLFWVLTHHRIRVRYKQSVLGIAWAVLQPLALMLIFTLAFGRIAKVPSEKVPYPLFVYSGLLIWSFLSTGLSNSAHSVVAHASLITKVYFPREILPLTYLAAALWALPVVVVLAAFATAGAFLLSALQVRFRDVGIAVPLLLYLWLFSTPIGYPLSSVPAAYRPWFLLNPMTGIVESFRRAIVHGMRPELDMLALPVLAAAVLLPISYVVFKRIESTMADVI